MSVSRLVKSQELPQHCHVGAGAAHRSEGQQPASPSFSSFFDLANFFTNPPQPVRPSPLCVGKDAEKARVHWDLLQSDLADAVQAGNPEALQQSVRQMIQLGVGVFSLPQFDQQIKDAHENEVFWREQVRQSRLVQPANCKGVAYESEEQLSPQEEQLSLAILERRRLEAERHDALQSYRVAVEDTVNTQLSAVPAEVLALLASQFESQREPEEARKLFMRASDAAETVAMKQLYRLQSIKTQPTQQLAQHQAEIEAIAAALEQTKPIAQEWSELSRKGEKASQIFTAYQLAMANAANEDEMRQIGHAFSEQYGKEFDDFFLDPRVMQETDLSAQEKAEEAAAQNVSPWQPVIDVLQPPAQLAPELQNELPPGDPEQVALASSLAWQLRLQAELTRRQPRFDRLHRLKDELLAHIRDRQQQEALTPFEVQLLAQSALLVTQAATAHLQGALEVKYLADEGNVSGANRVHEEYLELQHATEDLLRKVPDESQVYVRETLAQLSWQAEVEARSSIHQYTDAFEQGIRRVEEKYADTRSFALHRDAYVNLYPEHFDATTRQVLSNVDLSETDKAKAAVLREASLAALHGDNVEQFLLTAGYAVMGGGFGCVIGGALGGGGGFLSPVPGGTAGGAEFGCAAGTFVGGFLGGSTGEILHQQETIRRHGAALREAAQAGMSVVDAGEYRFNQDAAATAMYMSGLSGAVLYGNFAAPLGRTLYATESWASRALARAGRSAEAWVGRAAETMAQEQLAGAGAYGSVNMMSQALEGASGVAAAKNAARIKDAIELTPHGPWKSRLLDWVKSWGQDLKTNAYDGIIKGSLNSTERARIAALRQKGVAGNLLAKAYESYIQWSSPVYFFGGLAVAGYDISDGKLSAAGGIAAALGPMPALQKLALGIRRSGTRVAVGFSLGMEWMNQAQQGIDLKEPDGMRLLAEAFWAGPLRAYMNVVVQGTDRVNGTLLTPFVRGAQYMMKKVPGVGTWMDGSVFHSIEHASRGPQSLLPFWRPDANGKAVHTIAGRTASLTYLTPAIALVSYRLAQDQKGDFMNTFKGRFFDYAVAAYLFFPLKARLGMDTGRAEFVTRALGVAQRYPTNEIYKKYTASLPGYRLALVEALEGNPERALARSFKAMTEWTPIAGVGEPSGDGRWYDISARASGTYRQINLASLEGADGTSDHDYAQTLAYHVHDRELDLERAADAYLDFAEWKLSKLNAENLEHHAFLEELLLIDRDVLRAFVDRTINAPASQRAEWTVSYVETRNRLTQKAQRILEQYRSSFDLIDTHYYRNPEGVLKRIEDVEKNQ